MKIGVPVQVSEYFINSKVPLEDVVIDMARVFFDKIMNGENIHPQGVFFCNKGDKTLIYVADFATICDVEKEGDTLEGEDIENIINCLDQLTNTLDPHFSALAMIMEEFLPYRKLSHLPFIKEEECPRKTFVLNFFFEKKGNTHKQFRYFMIKDMDGDIGIVSLAPNRGKFEICRGEDTIQVDFDRYRKPENSDFVSELDA